MGLLMNVSLLTNSAQASKRESHCVRHLPPLSGGLFCASKVGCCLSYFHASTTLLQTGGQSSGRGSSAVNSKALGAREGSLDKRRTFTCELVVGSCHLKLGPLMGFDQTKIATAVNPIS